MAKAQMKEFKVTEHHSGRNPKVNIFKAFTKHGAVKKAMNQDKNFDKLKSVEVEVHKPTRVEKFSKKSAPKNKSKNHVVKAAQASEKQFDANHPKVMKFVKSHLAKDSRERVAIVDVFEAFKQANKSVKIELPEFNHHLRTENLELNTGKALVGTATELDERHRKLKKRVVTRLFGYKFK